MGGCANLERTGKRLVTGKRILIVLLLVVILCIGAGAQSLESSGDAGAEGRMNIENLKPWVEIEVSNCRRISRNPLSLLCLLPGLLFFLAALFWPRQLKVFFLSIMVCLLSLGGSPVSGDVAARAERLVGQAEQAAKMGDFESAFRLYSEVDNILPGNAALKYNLAFCSRAMARNGSAVFYLRQALSLKVGDSAVRQDLKGLELDLGLDSQIPPPPPIDADLVYILTLVLGNLVLILAGLFFRLRQVKLLIMLILLFAVSLGSLGLFLSLGRSRAVGIVATETAPLKKTPLPNSSSWIGLRGGTTLTVLGETADYFLVETGFELKGWIERKLLLLDDSHSY